MVTYKVTLLSVEHDINSTINWGWTAVSPSKTTSLIFLKNSSLK